jgi:hypothetical protein
MNKYPPSDGAVLNERWLMIFEFEASDNDGFYQLKNLIKNWSVFEIASKK